MSAIDVFRQINWPNPIPSCPVCGCAAQLWELTEAETGAVTKAVSCSNDELVQRSSNGSCEIPCPLYLPPHEFYCATKREALDFWDEFSVALIDCRANNHG